MPAKKTKTASQKKGGSNNNMENLKQFIRTRGSDYLKDKNISSVGIGYKHVNGKPTKEIAIQFTVNEKASPESLESLETAAIPETIVVSGKEYPTDVIQRSFEPSFRVVTENTMNTRKVRIDPITPGVSVGNIHSTAGTIGCIVFDKETGIPYILSNWHVLHGNEGDIGDVIVQPGPFDDNRVTLNHIGKLVRSHLGAAGDCAVAVIENRSFRQEIFELTIKPEEIGEPELGDKVIKSGRTTGVTHGIVTRIHTMVKIDYGEPAGEQSVGGFEIGPDQNNMPGNGEISMGGDSGSIWLFKLSNGKPSKIMAGLHFAGEGTGDPNEHAVACYPASVFEKLQVTLTPSQPVETEATAGYSSTFLGHNIKMPKLSHTNLADAVKLNGSEIINYTHFSLAQSMSRRFAFWVAWNIDGDKIKKVSRNGIQFILDNRFPEFQVGDDLYKDNRLDRGHIARRADLVWGTLGEAKKANKDSFFFSNITPQMDNFNQGNLGGIWGNLEDAVFEEADVENLRISVFGGPVFKDDDRIFRGIKIPREFYKVLAFVENGKLKAKAFLLTQNLDQLELLELSEFKVFQVTLGEIEQRCDFTFPSVLKDADEFAEGLQNAPESVNTRQPIEKLSDIKW